LISPASTNSMNWTRSAPMDEFYLQAGLTISRNSGQILGRYTPGSDKPTVTKSGHKVWMISTAKG